MNYEKEYKVAQLRHEAYLEEARWNRQVRALQGSQAARPVPFPGWIRRLMDLFQNYRPSTETETYGRTSSLTRTPSPRLHA